ncbi:MAG: helix-turn-helix domain-containing protein [Streptomyces sp.]|jgi:transcriptional regulator with XRE-family HTH domain|nr:helix-turn-helix domain-containing protein [Streptomyces sp.]
MNAEDTAQTRSEGPPGRADLSELVRNRMDELGLSFRAVADASANPDHPDEGPAWKRGTLENLVKGRTVKAPSETQLQALADALRVPLLAVQRAASAQFFGYVAERWSDDHQTRVFVARVDELDGDELAELDELAQIILRRRGRRSEGA